MIIIWRRLCLIFFFFNDTATTEIYTLSLHDALPICSEEVIIESPFITIERINMLFPVFKKLLEKGVKIYIMTREDRKSTRLNSSHQIISYAVFCLKKKTTPLEAHTPGPSWPRSTRAP